MMRRFTISAIILFSIVIQTAACGGDTGSGEPESSGATTSSQTSNRLDEMRLDEATLE